MTAAYYISQLTGKVYKLLPMREEEERGAKLYLDDYLSSLTVEATGAQQTFPALLDDRSYVAVLNTLNYLRSHELAYGLFRREVLKMLRSLNLIEKTLGGNGT